MKTKNSIRDIEQFSDTKYINYLMIFLKIPGQ